MDEFDELRRWRQEADAADQQRLAQRFSRWRACWKSVWRRLAFWHTRRHA